MHSSTVTNKGQITIPSNIRKSLNIKSGDKVVFEQAEDKVIITITHKAPLMSLCGFLPKPKVTLTIDEINEIIESHI